VKLWLHAEHLLVDGQKMSKSLGNFYTLRDLFAQGHKPSSIRLLLASVPYRRQLNFTMEGLQQAASSVERLRNFMQRMRAEKLGVGATKGFDARVQKAEEDFDAGLSDDLNTAQALAAAFDLVRDANIAMDRGEFKRGDADLTQAAMQKFDMIFGVLVDDDAERLRTLGFAPEAEGISDKEIEELVAKRVRAKKARDFGESDRIRDLLAERGVVLEDTKDGSVRWKRR
jgi:cysteinyl-tRNA synthetase